MKCFSIDGVIIEIGAGSTIPTVRREGENLAKKYPNIQLIRINPVEAELIPNSINGVKGFSIERGDLEGLRVVLDEPIADRTSSNGKAA